MFTKTNKPSNIIFFKLTKKCKYKVFIIVKYKLIPLSFFFQMFSLINLLVLYIKKYKK